MESVLDMPFIFIVGAPRSGTTWLASMLADHPDVASLPGEELTIHSRYLAPVLAKFRNEKKVIEEREWRQGLPLVISEEEFIEWLRSLISTTYAGVLKRNPEAKTILDKHPNYAQHMDLITELLPQSRFIHIIRDGREVAVSMMSANKRVGHSPGNVNRAAFIWEKFIRKARNSETSSTGRYMEVRYEALRSETPSELTRILQHAQLSIEPSWVSDTVRGHSIENKQVSSGNTELNAVRDVKDAIWKNGLSLWERKRFDVLAGDLLAELGYSEKGWWKLAQTDGISVFITSTAKRIKKLLRAIGHSLKEPLD